MELQERMREFADSHETSIEIVRAIFFVVSMGFELGGVPSNRSEEEIWEDPTPQEKAAVIELAFTEIDDGESLYWGIELLTK